MDGMGVFISSESSETWDRIVRNTTSFLIRRINNKLEHNQSIDQSINQSINE